MDYERDSEGREDLHVPRLSIHALVHSPDGQRSRTCYRCDRNADSPEAPTASIACMNEKKNRLNPQIHDQSSELENQRTYKHESRSVRSNNPYTGWRKLILLNWSSGYSLQCVRVGFPHQPSLRQQPQKVQRGRTHQLAPSSSRHPMRALHA